MEIYTPKTKIKLSPVIRNGREFVEVTFGNDNDIRLSLSKEENVLLVGGRAYLPAEDFVLAEFFDRYVKMAFIDYSAIKETAPRKEEDKRPPLPEGYLEKLQQVRYSDHTVRVYTSYFRDFQQHFEGRKIETVTPGEINDYLLYLIHEKNISSCQQNQRINAIKFYYEKVLGQERRCYKVNRAKREKTLPDVLSKEEIKKILDATVTDLRFFCMFSILYSAGLRISELLELKPGDINESRSLIRVRQGKGKKDRYTLLSKPLMKKLTEYNRLYKPKVWLFEHRPGEPFTESIVSKRLKAAAREAGITKRIYPHLLRHSLAAFDRFRAQNVTDLILDLRYNNGGDVLSSTVLGTLIAGEAYKGQLYAHMTFNEDRTEAGESGDYKIGVKETFESVYEPIERALQHALGLKKIYVLVSETTASASEMVINGLRGLDIEVNLIGMPTNGKNVGMEGVVRSFHNYDFLLFPVSFYIENAKGFRDYSDGFTPDVQIDDSAIYPGEFGTMMDQLGYLALQWIKTDNKPQLPSAMHTRGSCRSMRSFGDLWENRPVQPVGGAVMQPVREE